MIDEILTYVAPHTSSKKKSEKKIESENLRKSAHSHTFACFTACGGAAKCRDREDCEVSLRIFGDVEKAENLKFGSHFATSWPRHRHRDQEYVQREIMQQSRQSKQQVSQPACQPGRQQAKQPGISAQAGRRPTSQEKSSENKDKQAHRVSDAKRQA